MSKISISIVNHSNPGLTKDCVRSLKDAARRNDLEIIIVDNAHPQGNIDLLVDELDNVKFIFNDSQQGFAFNHNQAMRMMEGDYMCIMNDDMIAHPESIDVLAEHISSDDSIGMVVPRLLNRDGSVQLSVFTQPTLLSELIDLTYLPKVLSRLKWVGIDRQALYSEVPVAVDWALGACMLISRDAYRNVGGLDSDLFPVVDREDTEWCDRFRKEGYRIELVPESKMLHYYGSSKKNDCTFKLTQIDKASHLSRARYFSTRYGAAGMIYFKIVYCIATIANTFMLAKAAVSSSRPIKQILADLVVKYKLLFTWRLA